MGAEDCGATEETIKCRIGRQVDGAKLVDFQKLVAKFSNRDLVRVARKYVLIEKEVPKTRPPEEW